MRIVIQATQLAPGGGLTHFNRIGEWFGRLAPDSEFIVLCHEGQQGLFEPRPRNFHFRFYSTPSRSLAHRVYWERVHLPRVVAKFRPDLFFVPGNRGIARVNCPKVSLIHNIAPFGPEYTGDERLYQKLRQTLLKRATISTIQSSQGVIYLSNHSREFFSEIVDHGGARTAVVYHGGHGGSQAMDDGATLHRLKIDSPYLLCVSHIFRYKKISEMVQAYFRAVEQNASLPRLYVAGTCYDEPYLEGIKRRLQKTGFSDRVAFLGNVDENELPALYRSCVAFLFPSALETCSVILIEAMTHGCAIACSDRSCLPEVTGGRALYYNPDDIEDFAGKIRSIVEDRDLNSRLKRNSLERAKDFSWEASSQQILDFFADVAGNESVNRDRLRDLSAAEAT